MSQQLNDELEKARQLIQAEKERNAQACLDEIQTVLDKYEFEMRVSPGRIMLIPQSK